MEMRRLGALSQEDRFELAHFARDGLHPRGIDGVLQGEDGEAVAFKRLRGEDVEQGVVQAGGHGSRREWVSLIFASRTRACLNWR